MSKDYPKGTNVREITQFDRGTKVVFECQEHPGPQYASKDPFASQWFPRNKQAMDISDRLVPDPCPHTAKDDVWVTSTEYTGLA